MATGSPPGSGQASGCFGKAWAARSAATLARRLRREKLHSQPEEATLRLRAEVLTDGLRLHRHLDKINGAHVHNLGAAIAGASVKLSQRELAEAKCTKRASDWARHAAFAVSEAPARPTDPQHCGVCWCGAWVWPWSQGKPQATQGQRGEAPELGRAELKFQAAVAEQVAREEANQLWWKPCVERRFATAVLHEELKGSWSTLRVSGVESYDVEGKLADQRGTEDKETTDDVMQMVAWFLDVRPFGLQRYAYSRPALESPGKASGQTPFRFPEGSAAAEASVGSWQRRDPCGKRKVGFGW